jgi:3-keto-disaccharide hydrolase
MIKRVLLLAAFAVTGFAADGFVPLFNGKNLDGWDGDPRLWSVKNGIIVGSTEGVSLEHNEFLISKKEYSNFILRCDMKLRNHNSGIQFRSKASPEWVVSGYQADAAENNYWGCLYEEKGKRGIMVNSYKDIGEKVVKLKDWNTYEILCDGDHIQIKLNGMVTADIHDSLSLSGVIAMQLHKGPPMEAYFRNVAIKILK